MGIQADSLARKEYIVFHGVALTSAQLTNHTLMWL